MTEETVNVGDIGLTRMFCEEPEGVMEQEQEYLQALQNSTTYKVDRNRMEFRDDSGALQVDFETS